MLTLGWFIFSFCIKIQRTASDLGKGGLLTLNKFCLASEQQPLPPRENLHLVDGCLESFIQNWVFMICPESKITYFF